MIELLYMYYDNLLKRFEFVFIEIFFVFLKVVSCFDNLLDF